MVIVFHNWHVFIFSRLNIIARLNVEKQIHVTILILTWTFSTTRTVDK